MGGSDGSALAGSAGSGGRDASAAGDAAAWDSTSMDAVERDDGPSTRDAGSNDVTVAKPEGGVMAADGGGVGEYSVLQRGNDVYRRATFVQPALTKAAAAAMAIDDKFNAAFNGEVFGSPLYVEKGPAAPGCPAAAKDCAATTRPAGGGVFLVASATNDVYGFDETTGAVVWHTNIGPVGVDPLRGAPAVDPVSRTLFVTTTVSIGGSHHEVHALSVDDGTERRNWPITIPTTSLPTNLGSTNENQHGALLLLNGVLYVPFGGHRGDCCAPNFYRGWVVAIDIVNPARVGAWVSAGVREGVWAHGGLASDGTSVFAVTGNSGQAGVTPSGDHRALDGNEVVRLGALATFARTGANVYYPTQWKDMDMNDQDFGSSSPAYVPLGAGSTPSGLLVAGAKNGIIYFLNGDNLSQNAYPNPGGEIASIPVMGDARLYMSPTVYSTPSGLHIAINTGSYPICPANGPQPQLGGHMILSMLIPTGAPQNVHTVWCAPVMKLTECTNACDVCHYPPISTTTDGRNNALVWSVDGRELTALDGETGAPVYTGGDCAGVPDMTLPVAAKGRIVVAGNGHLCSWSPH